MTRLSIPRWVILVVVAMGSLGCASVDRRAGFDEVQTSIAERTGYRVHWRSGSEEDRSIRQMVRALVDQPLRAESAVQVALLNNRRLQATYQELGIAQADLVEAGRLPNPVLDAEFRFAAAGSGTGIELGLAQDFLEILLLPRRKAIAAAEFEVARARVTGEVLGLAARTREAFIDLQAAEQLLELQTTSLEATSASYELAKRLYAAGNITALDLANERAFHEQVKVDTAEAEAMIVQFRERLSALMGLWAGWDGGMEQPWTIASRRLPALSALTVDPQLVESIAIERSLDLLEQRWELQRAARELGITQPLTSLDLGVSAEREPEGDWSVGPSFSLPVPLFNQAQPAIARALSRFEQAEELYAGMAIEIRAAARAAYLRTVSARQRAEYFQAIILPLQEEAVEQAQLQYNAMQLGSLLLLQAKRDQLEAAQDWIEALRDYWVASSELDLILAGRAVELRPQFDELPRTSGEPDILREEFQR